MTRTADQILRPLYAAFNSRDIEVALGGMCADVEWANGMDGGVVHGHSGVREYWTRQWGMIDPTVEPLTIQTDSDGRHDVEVHAIVKDLQGAVLVDRIVHHVYRLRDGLVVAMEIRE